MKNNKIIEAALNILKSDAEKIKNNASIFLRWSVISVITGLIVGSFSILFVKWLVWANLFRLSHTYILFALPLAGILIVSLYGFFDYKNDKGTNLVISTIHAESEIPFRMAPLIFISTILTHLFGGSAGREGAALQLGGSIGNQLGRWFHLDENDTRVIVMCGMSAAFSAVFGTPIAAAVFSMEVISVGIMYYAALVPCVFASIVASIFARSLEITPEKFFVTDIPSLAVMPSLKIVLLGVLCALLSIVFCRLLHGTGDLYRHYFKNPYIRIIFSSIVFIILTLILGTYDYCGAGIPVIEKAITGVCRPTDFFWKMIFTALTIEAGFKGGEIVPSFFVGATFGCLYGNIVGLSPSLCAAVGMIAIFCGVTNCPITSMMISAELFGFPTMKYMLIGVAISYMLSGYSGLYHEQTIVYSKYKTTYINKKTTEH